MSALTGPRDAWQRDGANVRVPMAAVQCWQGGAAAIVSGTGNATPLVPATATNVFIGVFGESYNNSAGAAAAYSPMILRQGIVYFNQSGTTFTEAHLKLPVYFSDDNTVTLTAGTTYAGTVEDVDASGQIGVDITKAVQSINPSSGFNLVPLSGSADAINPHVESNYVITKAGVDAMTLAAPTATIDDGKVIQIDSTTANAHTLTATGLLNTGAAAVNVATFAAHAGASVRLRAYQGAWYVEAQIGITFS